MSLNLCLDLGTAYSKAAAWTKNTNYPLPLHIGDAVGHSGYTVPTAVLITRQGRVHFGQDAFNQGYSANVVFTDLKRYMTRQCEPLDTLLVPSKFNPTRIRLTVRQVTSLYMAFLSHAAVQSLRSEGHRVSEVVERTLTMPVFGGKQDVHSRKELGLAARLGWEMKNDIRDGGVSLTAALQKLRSLERRSSVAKKHNLEIVEPLAAIAARMATYDPTKEAGRRLSMVIDVGAGTVDFGLFVSGLSGEDIGVFPITGAKYSLPVGGNDIDAALVEFVLERSLLSGDRLAEARARLQEEARDLKERLLDREDDDSMYVAEARVRLTKDEFLNCDAFIELANRIETEFWKRLRRIDPSWLELASMLTQRGIGIFLSGGGAKLPFLRSMVPQYAPQRIESSPEFYLRIAEGDPSWSNNPDYFLTWRQVGRVYPQMAVSLGGAVFGAGVNDFLAMGKEVKRWAGATRQ